MKRFVVACGLVFHLLGTSVLVQSCRKDDCHMQDGDLIFCVAAGSAMSDAIVDATKAEGGMQYDHVAIFAHIDGVPSVIEANPKYGVRACTLSEFLEDVPDIDDKKGITVKRVTKPTDVDAAIGRALQLIGQPYDWSYRPDNGKVYCSELVYDCYLDDKGAHIFSASPMNFRNEKGEMPAFWTEVFKKIGEEVPEGVPGTNPNDMSSESFLTTIQIR